MEFYVSNVHTFDAMKKNVVEQRQLLNINLRIQWLQFLQLYETKSIFTSFFFNILDSKNAWKVKLMMESRRGH